jgi:P-type Ca2+ transporter type 2C
VFMSAAINLVIVVGRDHYGNIAIRSTMGLVAFSLMLVIAAFESRDETGSILRMETLDNNVVNVTMLIEVVLAILITRGGFVTSLLSTQALTGRQWLLGGTLPAVVLFVLWELGKLIARRAGAGAQAAPRAEAMPSKAVAG